MYWIAALLVTGIGILVAAGIVVVAIDKFFDKFMTHSKDAPAPEHLKGREVVAVNPARRPTSTTTNLTYANTNLTYTTDQKVVKVNQVNHNNYFIIDPRVGTDSMAHINAVGSATATSTASATAAVHFTRANHMIDFDPVSDEDPVKDSDDDLIQDDNYGINDDDDYEPTQNEDAEVEETSRGQVTVEHRIKRRTRYRRRRIRYQDPDSDDE